MTIGIGCNGLERLSPHLLGGLGILMVSMLLPGCASSSSAANQKVADQLAEQGWRAGEEVRSVSGYRVQGFRAVDDQHVIIETTRGRRYLVSTSNPCADLRNDEQLRVSTNVANELTTLDTIYAKDAGAGQACAIAKLQKLERISSAE